MANTDLLKRKCASQLKMKSSNSGPSEIRVWPNLKDSEKVATEPKPNLTGILFFHVRTQARQSYVRWGADFVLPCHTVLSMVTAACLL